MNRPYMLYDSASPIVFDGNVAVCFIVYLRNDVLRTRIRNVAPGVLYTFIIHQLGEFEFTWPEVCRNAAPVLKDAHTTTTQNFIGNTGGYLDANAVGTWAE